MKDIVKNEDTWFRMKESLKLGVQGRKGKGFRPGKNSRSSAGKRRKGRGSSLPPFLGQRYAIEFALSEGEIIKESLFSGFHNFIYRGKN